jgi:predicted nucleic acid-binding protein
MGTEIGAAIADAGPIIHLYEIGVLRFLRLFDPVHVPEAVWEETVGEERVPPSSLNDLDVLERHHVRSAQVQSLVDRTGLHHLQKGECECLSFLDIQDPDLLLTDDLAVRDAVDELGGTPVGSLGVVVRACRENWIDIDEAERLLRQLHEASTLFVTEALIEIAIDQLQADL